MKYHQMSLDEVLTAWETAGSPTVCDGDALFALWGWEYFA